MNLAETGMLLAFISALDNRKFSDESAVAWHELLGEYRYDETKAAAKKHYSETTDWLLPGHLVKLVRASRKSMIDSFMSINANRIDSEDVASDLRIRRLITKAISAGRMTPAEYEDYHARNVPWADYERALGTPRELKRLPPQLGSAEALGRIQLELKRRGLDAPEIGTALSVGRTARFTNTKSTKE